MNAKCKRFVTTLYNSCCFLSIFNYCQSLFDVGQWREIVGKYVPLHRPELDSRLHFCNRFEFEVFISENQDSLYGICRSARGCR